MVAGETTSGYEAAEAEDASLDFPAILGRACAEAARGLQSRAAILYLYDDLADDFIAAATVGDEARGLRGTVPSSSLREELLQALTTEGSRAIDIAMPDGDTRRCLLVPLIDVLPAGVVAAPIEQGVPFTMLPDWSAASTRIARSILDAMPDIDHDCLFRRILDVDPGGIAVVEGAEYVFSYATSAFREIFSGRTEPFLGRSAASLLASHGGREALNLLGDAFQKGRQYHSPQLTIVDELGERHFELHLIPQATEQGAVRCVYVILWPRTDAVLTRQALEATIHQLADSQGVLSAVLNGTNNGIIFIDRAGTIQYANRRANTLLGIDVGALIGQESARLSEAMASRIVGCEDFIARRGWLDTHPGESVTDEIQTRGEPARLLECYSSPVHSEAGEFLGRVEVYTDVTAIRGLQRNKDDFLSLVSHELRTPVTSIKGYAQLLRRRAVREDMSDGVLNACNVIERQAEKMQVLIDTLLDLSRLETGRLGLSPEPVDLCALVLAAAELAQLTAERHVIELDVPREPVVAYVDARRIEQVIANLLSNAVRFSPQGGVVTLTVRPGDPIEIKVADTGPGIPESIQSHIFERFFKAGGLETSTGMGIGLYITRGIIEQHGGSIRVDSSPGGGATFTVALPASRDGRKATDTQKQG